MPDQGLLFPALSAPRAQGRRLAPGRNQPSHDMVMTPPALARQIVDYYQPSGVLLDPCRGDGAFFNAMLRWSKDVRWCEVAEGRDFLTWQEPADWIITNPPWSKFRPFLRHAMRLAPNIVFLSVMTHFVTKARLRDITRAGFGIEHPLIVRTPRAPWPGSGFQLAAWPIRRGARSFFTTLDEVVPDLLEEVV